MSWLDNFLPASFRGVLFSVERHRATEGRRIAEFEFPDRDDGFTEDLGARLPRYRIEAILVGEDYDQSRDALRRACKDTSDPGTLVHPYLGVLVVRCREIWTVEESREGRAARFVIDFVEAGAGASPVSAADPASALLDGIDAMGGLVSGAFASAWQIAADPVGFGIGILDDWTGGLVSSLTGLATDTLNGFAPLIAAVTAVPGDAGATAAAAVTLTGVIADAVVATQAVPVPADDPVLGLAAPGAPPADPSGGLLASAVWGGVADPAISSVPDAALPVFRPGGWGYALPPIVATTPRLTARAANQAAALDLINGAATLAVASVFARRAWPTANAAATGRAQLIAAIDRRTDAAAASGPMALYNGWLGLAGLATRFLTAEAQQLPRLAPYAFTAAMPWLALAQCLYASPATVEADAARLLALNNARHPLFMPAAGLQLVT